MESACPTLTYFRSASPCTSKLDPAPLSWFGRRSHLLTQLVYIPQTVQSPGRIDCPDRLTKCHHLRQAPPLHWNRRYRCQRWWWNRVALTVARWVAWSSACHELFHLSRSVEFSTFVEPPWTLHSLGTTRVTVQTQSALPCLSWARCSGMFAERSRCPRLLDLAARHSAQSSDWPLLGPCTSGYPRTQTLEMLCDRFAAGLTSCRIVRSLSHYRGQGVPSRSCSIGRTWCNGWCLPCVDHRSKP